MKAMGRTPRSTSFALSLVFALPLLALGCGEAEPADSHSQGPAQPVQGSPRLAVARLSEAETEVVIARPGTRRVRVVVGRRLKGSTRPDPSPRVSWSPDGGQLAFSNSSSRGNDFKSDIYVVDVRTLEQRRVTTWRDSTEPVWSSDGKTIVFTRIRGSTYNASGSLWAIPVDGGDARQLTPSVRGRIDAPGSFSPTGSSIAITRSLLARSAIQPAYSPSGTRLAFSSDRDRNGSLTYGDTTEPATELYVSAADGTRPRRLTRTRDVDEYAPSWSPSGETLAFQRGTVIGNAEGYVIRQVNADGTCARNLLADPKLDTWYTHPAWRPLRSRTGDTRIAC